MKDYEERRRYKSLKKKRDWKTKWRACPWVCVPARACANRQQLNELQEEKERGNKYGRKSRKKRLLAKGKLRKSFVFKKKKIMQK